MLKILVLYGLIYLSISCPLFGEIQKVTVLWNNVSCNPSCGQDLHRWFSELKKTSKIVMTGGRAEMYWKPNTPFDYRDIKYVMARMGLYTEEIRIQVRGTITHDPDHFYMHSIGDSTFLEVLGPIKESTSLYIIKKNAANYKVVDPLRSELLQAEKDEFLVTIEGSLFMPEMVPPFSYMPSLKVVSQFVKVDTVD